MNNYPFLDDTYGTSGDSVEPETWIDNPAEFRHLPLSVTPSGTSKSARAALDRISETAAAAASPLSDNDLTDIGNLLTVLLSSHPSRTKDFAKDRVLSENTRFGTLHYVETVVNPMALLPNPANPRTLYTSDTGHSHDLLTVTGEAGLFPVVDVDAGDLLADASMLAARSTGCLDEGKLRNAKDRADLDSIGLHAPLKPGFVVLKRFNTPDGGHAWLPVIEDANRRYSLVLKVLHHLTGLPISALQPLLAYVTESASTLTPVDMAGVTRILQAAHRAANNVNGGALPDNHSDDALHRFLSGPYSTSMQVRTFWRMMRFPVRLVIGYAPASLRGDADPARCVSPMSSLTDAFVRSIHVDTEAQTAWPEEAQHAMMVREVLRSMQDRVSAGTSLLPLDTASMAVLTSPVLPRWTSPDLSVPDSPHHPARLAATTLAAFLCDDQDGIVDVRAATRKFNVEPGTKSKGTTLGAVLGTQAVTPLLFGANARKGDIAGAQNVLRRVFTTSTFTKVATHPGDPWWTKLTASPQKLADEAKRELAGFTALSDEDKAAAENGSGWFGPHGRALLALALIVGAASPAVLNSRSQLMFVASRQYGPGASHATPDAILRGLLDSDDGIDQLATILRAGLSTTVTVPANTLEPSEGDLTDEWLRRFHGDDSTDADDEESPESVYDTYDRTVAEIVGHITGAAEKLTYLHVGDPDADPDDGQTLAGLFAARGFDSSDVIRIINEQIMPGLYTAKAAGGDR